MKSFVKVFSVIFLPILVALIIGFYFMSNIMITHSENNLIQEMRNNWFILSKDINLQANNTTLNKQLRKITNKTSLRITIITITGKVIFDSFVLEDQMESLENHKSRPEVKGAIYSGEGTSIRYSKTISTDMMYFAKKMNNNLILRVSYPMKYLATLKNALTSQIWRLFSVLTMIILILSIYFARRVSLPVQKLNQIADSIENGERLEYFPHFKDKTMSKVAGLIYRIYNSMIKKQDELSKEQQKLNKIFSIMDQGIVLLDSENTVLHMNNWMKDKFEFDINDGEHLYKNTTDIDIIAFFSDITEKTENDVFRKNLKGRTYDIVINQIAQEKLILILDITVRSEYESFKTELTGNISHELKTPLSMMMMYSETLLNNKDIDEKTSTKFLEHIYSAAGRLNNLINDIIELHKLESNNNNFHVDNSTDLEIITDDLKSMYELSDKNITITSASTEVKIAYEHIQSVITNLVNNAIKYSDGSDINVSITFEHNKLQIDVEDSGPAIPLGERKRIFERFYTRSKSRNKHTSGTGLGLSIVKHITNIYSGSVEILNNNQSGNTFKVILFEKS